MDNLKFGFEPTHPGEVLKDEIEYRGLSQIELARQTGIPYKALNDMLNEHRPLSTSNALLFEAALDIPAESLMKLQMWYDLQVKRKDKSLLNRLSKIRKIAATITA